MIAASIQEKLSALTQEHRRRWRQWAENLAAGRPAPNPVEVLETAATLSIADPGEALESDASAIRELRAAEGAIESCRARCRELLAPWKGRLAKAQMALAAAEAEVARLKEIVSDASGGCSESYWTSVVHHIKRQHPRIFQEGQS